MWKHLRACVCRALLLVPFSQLHVLADKNTPQWDTQETHQLNWPISSAIWSCGQTAEHSHFVWSFHTGWPTSAHTHCCPYSLFRKQRPSLQTIPIAVLTAWSGNRGLPCKPDPLLSLQPDQETEAFLANHTHCCPYSLIRKQRPSLQTIPIAVLTAWSGNRGLPCKPYPLLSLQLDQETEAFLAYQSFFGLCYQNFTPISITDVSFHPSLVRFRNMHRFLTISITLVWLAWLTGCHKPI